MNRLSLEEYQKLTGRTNVDLGSPAINAAHCVLGIVGEINEFHNECAYSLDVRDVLKEAGDICWYCSELANIFEIQLKLIDLYLEDDDLEAKTFIMYESTSRISEQIKKFLAYSKELQAELISTDLSYIISAIKHELDFLGEDFENCLYLNIEKLKLRFPEDKFDKDLAIQQNDMK